MALAGDQSRLGHARSGQMVWFWADCDRIHLLINGTRSRPSGPMNAIVAALHAAAAKADDVEVDAINDAYADHVVQVMATSLRKLNRLLGQLIEGQHRPAEQGL
jgi:predicted RNA polymerase sigma factor